MALFPQFPYSNLHELNLDWIIENISQLVQDGAVISVNGMTGVVTLYTDKDVTFPPRAFDDNWAMYRRIADKLVGVKFTGEKFYYITKNIDDEEFTAQEIFTTNNLPPYPVTSVNNRTGSIIIAGDNTPYNADGEATIEDVITSIQNSFGPVIQYKTCPEYVIAGQYVYLFMSGITGREDGIYKAVNSVAGGVEWTAADLEPVSGGIGGVVTNNEYQISQLNSAIGGLTYQMNAQKTVFVQLSDQNIAGSVSSPGSNTYDMTPYLPSGYSLWAAEVQIQDGQSFYNLPWFNDGLTQATWIDRFNGNNIVIKNKATWSANTSIKFTLHCKRN